MFKQTLKNRRNKLFGLALILFLILFTNLSIFIANSLFTTNNTQYKSNNDYDNEVKTAKLDYVINLTNYEINNTRHYHNTILTIKGVVYEPINPDNTKTGVNVVLVVNGNLNENYSDISGTNGEFEINYIIPYTLDVYSEHRIEADSPNNQSIQPNNYFMINVSANSYIDISYPHYPYLPSENLNIDGYLKYDNENGSGIINGLIEYYWTNGTYNWEKDNFTTNSIDGSISETLEIPNNPSSENLFLNLSYTGNLPYINYSTLLIGPIEIFHNISCDWNTNLNVRVNQTIEIEGEISALGRDSLKIYNRSFRIIYDGTERGSFSTDINGNFSYDFVIPTGTGNRTLSIRLIEDVAGYDLGSRIILNVSQAISPPPTPIIITPFQWFFIIGLPIIIGVIAALGIYGYFYYKREIAASRLVNIPLEGKIRNLKILKDSGRIEEALSYLFNAIYVELASAKYGRKRKDNETIRDYAIISVQDFNLDPAKIYPFIQKIEQIIYAQPYKITEKDFYKTIELFSPVYYELTGYNFILNF